MVTSRLRCPWGCRVKSRSSLGTRDTLRDRVGRFGLLTSQKVLESTRRRSRNKNDETQRVIVKSTEVAYTLHHHNLFSLLHPPTHERSRGPSFNLVGRTLGEVEHSRLRTRLDLFDEFANRSQKKRHLLSPTGKLESSYSYC